MPAPILATKLFMPVLRTGIVPRPRLVEKLNHGIQGPLTLISAPAGYGKTTLLAEWRSGPGSRTPIAWLSLDNEDNDPSRFLTYLATALSALKAGTSESALAILQSPQSPPTQVILTSLINNLVDALVTPYALVLDDYHVITSQSVHDAMTFLLDHLPPQMHLVLLTRADPPLPLANLRARGQVMELRAADLRFTVEEATAFLNQAMGLVLSPEQVKALEQRTEGWVAALQLAALSMQGREDVQGFVSAFSGSHYYIMDYLVDEVLNRQPDAVREFLLRTSILDRLTAPLCNVLTNRIDGQEILKNLERANLFVVPLDDEQYWYRYHRLFADAIRKRLQQERPGWIPNLHRHATEWYAQKGFVSEAIRHALAGDDLEEAARLIEGNAQPMVTRRELVTLANWLKAVESLITEHPWLCIYQAWVLFFTGQAGGLEKYLQEAERLIAAKTSTNAIGEDDLRGQIATIRTGIAFLRGDADRAIELSQQALEYLPEGNFEARALVIYARGGSFWLKGDIAAASSAFEDLERGGRAAGKMPVVVMALCSLARLLSLKGQLRHAADYFREAIQLGSSQQGHLLPIASEACAGLGHIHYEWNDLDTAANYLEKYAEISQLSGVASYRILGQALLARLYQVRGDNDSAFELLRRAEELAGQSTLGIDTDTRFTAFRINIRMDGGDLESASRLIQERGMAIESVDRRRREPEYVAFVRMLLATGKYDEALKLAELLIHSTESRGLFGYGIALLILEALAFSAKGDIPQALGVLERSLSIAQPEGYIRTFLDEGAPMAELLRHVRSKGKTQSYVTKLLVEFDKEASVRLVQKQPLIEPLSERELEILRLVAAGKSNQEIADTLIIATGTVKKHLHNIFGKLGVQSRTQCLAKARELGLG